MFAPARRSICALLTLAALAFTASTASAQHRPTRPAPQKHHRPPAPQQNLNVAFDSLRVTADRSSVTIQYTIDNQDWRQLSRHNIRPRLNLYTASRHGEFTFAHAADLPTRTGEVTFSGVSLRRSDAVELRLSGDRGRVKIATTAYRNTRGNRVRIAVASPPPPRRDHRPPAHPPARRWTQAELIDACNNATSWSSDLSKCIEKGGRLADAPNTVAACGAQTQWSSDLLKCLDLAANLRFNPDATIRACGAQTQWSSDFVSCLTEAPHLGRDAVEIVNSCGAATQWSTDFKNCLVASRRT